MAGIIDYIRWRGDLGFKASKFNVVDNLIISKLSYMSFADIMANKKHATINEIAMEYFNSNNNKDIGVLLTGEFDLMLELMAKSNRYGQLNLVEYVEIIDEDIEEQFAAITVELNKHAAYIAFRGTDDTLVGWKEDFKMSFLDVVPAQEEAVNYVNKIIENHEYHEIYIGGHSKGGNLAVYSAVYAKDSVKKKIVNVYNNDGPGFKQRLLDTQKYKAISDKIVTLVPQSSVVGMLLEHEESYHVVKSNQKGVLQHDGFSWEVMGADFEYLSNVDDECKIVNMTVKKVLNTMTLAQREEFINILFDIISVNENRTLAEIKKDGIKNLYQMSKKYKALEKDTKKAISQTVSLFFGEGFRSFFEVKNTEQWNLKSNNWRKDVPQLLSKYLYKKDHA